MPANCVRKAFHATSGSAKTLLFRSSSPPLDFKACKVSGIPSARTSSASRLSVQKITLFRHPVELASLQSLMPLHCVTASALFNSLFSLHNETWGCLSKVDLMKEGATLTLRNAKIDMFKVSMRLAVDRWGRVDVAEPPSFSVKEDNNLSLIEFELVEE